MRGVKRTTLCGVLLVIASAFCGSVESACGQAAEKHEDAVSQPALPGTQWRLTEVAGQSIPRRSAKSYLTFERGARMPAYSVGQMRVSDGCNEYIGSYVIRGASLELTPQSGTLVACLIGADDRPITPSFLTVLRFVSRFEIQGHTLVLHGERGVVLARMDPVQPY
jgi:heat shock protein HslJ